jgi:hypothetical protein
LVYINKYRNGRRGKGVEALTKQKINVSLEIPTKKKHEKKHTHHTVGDYV